MFLCCSSVSVALSVWSHHICRLPLKALHPSPVILCCPNKKGLMKNEANSVAREVGVRGKGHVSSVSGPDRLRPRCLRLSNMRRTQRWFIQDLVVIRVKIKTAHTHKHNKMHRIHTLCVLVCTGCHSRSMLTSVFIPKPSKMSSDVTFCDVNEMRRKFSLQNHSLFFSNSGGRKQKCCQMWKWLDAFSPTRVLDLDFSRRWTFSIHWLLQNAAS